MIIHVVTLKDKVKKINLWKYNNIKFIGTTAIYYDKKFESFLPALLVI